MTVLTTAYFLLPSEHMELWAALGTLSAAAVVLGVHRNRPARRLPWYLLAAGMITFAAGDFSYNVLTLVLHQDNPFPSVADGFYLAMYPLCATALALFLRSRTPDSDRAALLDALVLTVGIALLSWVYLIQPFVTSPDLTWQQKVVSVSYPLGDVLLLAMIARLISAGGRRSTSLGLLTLATAGLLVADVFYMLIQLNSTWHVGGPVDLGWVCFYVLLGASALHPSMRTLTERSQTPAPALRRGRLLVVGAASLLAPGDWVVHSLLAGQDDALVHAAFSIALFVLVFVRMSGIVRVQMASNARERALRAAAADLVAAATPDDVRQSLARALRTLTQLPAITACLSVREGEVLHSYCGHGQCGGGPVRIADLSARLAEALDGTSAVIVASSDLGVLHSTREGAHDVALVLPLRSAEVLAGVLVVPGGAGPLLTRQASLETLGASGALALERIALARDKHERESEAHFRSLIQNSSDMILVVGANRAIAYQTPSVSRVLQHAPEQLAGTDVVTLLPVEDQARAAAMLDRLGLRNTRSTTQLEWRVRRADGTWVETEVLCSNLLSDPSVHGLVLTLRDVTDRRELQRELTRRAFQDSLTGLANRSLFTDRLTHALRRGSRKGTLVALLFIDLDDFKAVNDGLGHGVGDAVLAHVAGVLQHAVRSGDTAARLGGDEFALLVEDAGSEAEVLELATRVLVQLREPMEVDGQTVSVRASIGIATNAHAEDPTELLQLADLALYEAKELYKGGSRVFRDALRADLSGRLERRERLQNALEHGQFELLYQPVVRLDSGRLVGMEALVRWRDPARGLVAPDEFIADAEASGLIVPLGAWVLEEAVRQVGVWQQEHLQSAPLRLSVNVSARQFREPGFRDVVASVLERHPVRPWKLVLELTESLLIEDADVAGVLTSLRDLGVLLALDDFGTGYSALGYLQQFPIDILKLDKSFVADLLVSHERASLVEAIVHLARTLELDMVVEGVETAEQATRLHAMGCVYAQGYLYGRPQTAEDIGRLLAVLDQGVGAGQPTYSVPAPRTFAPEGAATPGR